MYQLFGKQVTIDSYRQLSNKMQLALIIHSNETITKQEIQVSKQLSL